MRRCAVTFISTAYFIVCFIVHVLALLFPAGNKDKLVLSGLLQVRLVDFKP